MSDGQAQIVLWVGFAIVAPIGIYHRIRSRTSERLNRRLEGWPVLLTLRPAALACLAGIVAFCVDPKLMSWAAVPLPSVMRWAGVPTGGAAAVLIIWTFRNLGRNLTDTVVTREKATLVMSGPYRWVRHPFYVAFALVLLANTLVTANAFIGVTGTVAFLAIVARTSIEERQLIQRFGEEYRGYMARTGRFFPRIGSRGQD